MLFDFNFAVVVAAVVVDVCGGVETAIRTNPISMIAFSVPSMLEWFHV